MPVQVAPADHGGTMKRDMDVLRRILLAIEASPHPTAGWRPQIEGVPDEVAVYNAIQAIDAGLVLGTTAGTLGSRTPIVILSRLTWAGHDFLDAAREPGRWERVKGMATAAGGVTFEVLKAWLVAAIPNPFGRAP